MSFMADLIWFDRLTALETDDFHLFSCLTQAAGMKDSPGSIIPDLEGPPRRESGPSLCSVSLKNFSIKTVTWFSFKFAVCCWTEVTKESL